MESKREQALVGLFVLIAGAVLVATVFALTGAFGGTAATYRAYFPFDGGLEPGATVRYAGGPKVGRVEKLNIDPQNPARIEVVFSVETDLPVKKDSRAKIMSMSPWETIIWKLFREAKRPRSPRLERSYRPTLTWTSMRSRQRSTTLRPRRSNFLRRSTIARARCK